MITPKQRDNLKIACTLLAMSAALFIFGVVISSIYTYLFGIIACIGSVCWIGNICNKINL